MKSNLALLFPLLFITMLLACNANKPKAQWEQFTSRAYLSDSLPMNFLQKINPTELQGVKLQRELSSVTYYFEYLANHKQVLKEMANLPFAADSTRADTHVRMIADKEEIKEISNLLNDVAINKDFLFEDTIDDYTVYECLKTPQHHIVLINKHSERIIHLIHQT